VLKKCLFLLVALILVVPFPSYSNTEVLDQITLAQKATYNLQRDGDSFCTAFVVKSLNGVKFISAGHCAKDQSKTYAAYDWRNNVTIKLKLLKFEDQWPSADYSVWEMVEPKLIPALPMSQTVPRIGDRVYGFVGPMSMVPFFITGVFSGIAWVSDKPEAEINGMFVVSLIGAPGASGSPVIDQHGYVWGILVGGSRDIQGTVLVVKVPRV